MWPKFCSRNWDVTSQICSYVMSHQSIAQFLKTNCSICPFYLSSMSYQSRLIMYNLSTNFSVIFQHYFSYIHVWKLRQPYKLVETTQSFLQWATAKTLGLLQPHFRLSELHQCDQGMLPNGFSWKLRSINCNVRAQSAMELDPDM